MKYEILQDNGRTLLVQQRGFPWLIKRFSGCVANAVRRKAKK